EIQGEKGEIPGNNPEITGKRGEITGNNPEITGKSLELFDKSPEIQGEKGEIPGNNPEITHTKRPINIPFVKPDEEIKSQSSSISPRGEKFARKKRMVTVDTIRNSLSSVFPGYHISNPKYHDTRDESRMKEYLIMIDGDIDVFEKAIIAAAPKKDEYLSNADGRIQVKIREMNTLKIEESIDLMLVEIDGTKITNEVDSIIDLDESMKKPVTWALLKYPKQEKNILGYAKRGLYNNKSIEVFIEALIEFDKKHNNG
ncbi:unnamed protein product, partial [marine sediment metagenome]